MVYGSVLYIACEAFAVYVGVASCKFTAVSYVVIFLRAGQVVAALLGMPSVLWVTSVLLMTKMHIVPSK